MIERYRRPLILLASASAVTFLGIIAGGRIATGKWFAGDWIYIILVALAAGAVIAFAARRIFSAGDLGLPTARVLESARYVKEAARGSFIHPVSDLVIRSEGGEIEVPFGAFNIHMTQILSEARNLSNDLNRLSREILGQSVRLSEGAEHERQVVDGVSGSLSRIDGGIRSILDNVEGLNSLAQDVSGLSRRVMTNTEQVAVLSEELSGFVREISTTITEIAGNIHSVADSTDSLSGSTSQSAASMSQISQVTQEIRGRAEEAARLVELVNEQTDRTRELMLRNTGGMQKLDEAVGRATRIIEGLGEQSEEIGNILTVISGIASETHLLSLNASIMAAKAGGHGLGFMVVANEIKSLAQRTAESTREIEGLINRTREGISDSIRAISEGNQQVSEGLKVSRDTDRSLSEVSRQVKIAVDHFREIARSTDGQAEMSRQVVKATADVEERTKLIKSAIRDQEDSSKYLDQRAQRMRELTDKVDSATKEQTESIHRISKSVDDFLGAVGLIRRATETQAQASSEIVQASREVGHAADLVAISGESVSNTAMSVLHQSLLLAHEMREFELPEVEPGLRIGLVLDNLREERWKRERQVFIDRAGQLGAVVVDRVADGDTDRQIEQASELLEEGVDILIVVAIDSEKGADMVEAAHGRGVKVLAYDRLIKNCDLDMFITYDYRHVGEMQARFMLKKVPVGRYLLLGGSPTDENALWLREGQLRVLHPLKKAGMVQTIEDRWCEGWSPDAAFEQVREALRETGGKIDALIASNDGTAGGAVRALEEFGLAGKVPVAGMDAELAACRRIVAGTQAMTVYMPIRLEAVRAAEVAILTMKDESIPGLEHTINNGSKDVPSILLRPVRVDRDNLDEVIIKEEFHSREDVYRRAG